MVLKAALRLMGGVTTIISAKSLAHGRTEYEPMVQRGCLFPSDVNGSLASFLTSELRFVIYLNK